MKTASPIRRPQSDPHRVGHPLLALQRDAGNRAVADLLAGAADL